MENYLETIYELSRLKSRVHVKDIADRLNITMPSVSEAIKKLADYGLVESLPYQDVVLTPEGHRIGKDIHAKHHLFKDFLQEVLHLPEGIAAAEACKLEHVLGNETVEALRKFMEQRKAGKETSG